MNIVLPKMHNGQRSIYADMERFTLIVAGRRWRKTTFASSWLLLKALKSKGVYGWFAPTHDQSRIAMRTFHKATKIKPNYSDRTLLLPNKSIIIFRSLERPENIRGQTLNECVIDEVAYIDETAWSEVLRPTLMDTGGGALMVTTPNGKNWIYDLFNKDSEFKTFVTPTLGAYLDKDKNLHRKEHPLENNNIPFSELLSMLLSMDSFSFRQEILAEFLDNTLGVFSNIDELCCLEEDNDQHVGHVKIAGLDVAKSFDYTALSVGCKTCKKEIFIKKLQGNYMDQASILHHFLVYYNVENLTVDVTGVGNAFVDILKDYDSPYAITPFLFSNKSKNELISNMILICEKKNFKFLNDNDWKNELYTFKRYQSTDKTTYGAVTGSHDDTVIARALMLNSSNKDIFL